MPCTCRFTDNENLVVRCGEWDMANDFEPVASQDRDIAQVMVHPGFWHGINHTSFLYRTQPPGAWPIFFRIDLDQYFIWWRNMELQLQNE